MSINVCSDCGLESKSIKLVDRIPLCPDCIEDAFGKTGFKTRNGADDAEVDGDRFGLSGEE